MTQASVRDVSLQASSSKIQVINLSACSINVVSPWNKFAVDILQVRITANTYTVTQLHRQVPAVYFLLNVRSMLMDHGL